MKLIFKFNKKIDHFLFYNTLFLNEVKILVGFDVVVCENVSFVSFVEIKQDAESFVLGIAFFVGS